METVDCLIIGSGVVGLAIARELSLAGREVIVAEKETHYGEGISSRNSGVIHAGIYYPPNSLKATLCVAGNQQLYRYCRNRSISFKNTGKLVVASNEQEVTTLHHYLANATANGVPDIQILDRHKIKTLEPRLKAEAALYSGSTGIIDVQDLLRHFIADIETNTGHLVFDCPVVGGHTSTDKLPTVRLAGSSGTTVRCNTLVNAAGLDAVNVAGKLGQGNLPTLLLSKGHWFSYRKPYPFNHLVYPVPAKTGLGIHATLTTDGESLFGPDAHWVDKVDFSFDESIKPGFIAAIRKYYPDINPDDLSPGFTGIRPKLGKKGDYPDFYIQDSRQHGLKGLVNLFGIESPGLTSSMAIAKTVASIVGGAS